MVLQVARGLWDLGCPVGSGLFLVLVLISSSGAPGRREACKTSACITFADIPLVTPANLFRPNTRGCIMSTGTAALLLKNNSHDQFDREEKAAMMKPSEAMSSRKLETLVL